MPSAIAKSLKVSRMQKASSDCARPGESLPR
jgi:hypothetical protein